MADKEMEENPKPTVPPKIEVSSDFSSGSSATTDDGGKKGFLDPIMNFMPGKRQKSPSPESRKDAPSGQGAIPKQHKGSPAKKGIMNKVSHLFHSTGKKETDEGHQKLVEEKKSSERPKSPKKKYSPFPTTMKIPKKCKVSIASSSVSSAQSESLNLQDDETDIDSPVFKSKDDNLE